jgi:phospholipid/cholesterol/gamma-HCH transport system ATP-binding protein
MLSTSSSENNNAIEIRELSKSYSGSSVLNKLNLNVPEGKTLIILGRSGVGKSVLLRHILGLESPDEGTIILYGKNIAALSQDEKFDTLRQVGMLFQGSALFDSLTVGQNVAFYHTWHPDPITGRFLSKDELTTSVASSLEKVGLPGFENMMPSDLSGGQKRRAALARLIIYRPKIVLYDEPTTGLDPITAMQINERIVSTSRELRATTIIVTHDLKSAFYCGDLFALIDKGSIDTVYTKEQFLQSTDTRIVEFLSNFHSSRNFS